MDPVLVRVFRTSATCLGRRRKRRRGGREVSPGHVVRGMEHCNGPTAIDVNATRVACSRPQAVEVGLILVARAPSNQTSKNVSVNG